MRTFYIAAIDVAGMAKSQSFYGSFADAQAVVADWVRRGNVIGQSWDKPLLFSTIADERGIIVTRQHGVGA